MLGRNSGQVDIFNSMIFEKLISKNHLLVKEYLYLKTYDELHVNKRYIEAFSILWDIIEQYTEEKKDKIVSVVDKDARVAHKSPGKYMPVIKP